MRRLNTAIRQDMELFGFKVLGLQISSEDEPLGERVPMKNRLRARVVVRDQRRHHPCYDLCYLVEVRSPYPTEEFRDVGEKLNLWRDYYRDEYNSEVQFVYQAHRQQDSNFYIVRQILNGSDERVANECIGKNV